MDSWSWIMWYIVTPGVLLFLVHFYHAYTFWKRRGIPQSGDIPYFNSISAILLRKYTFPQLVQRLYYRLPDAKYYGMINFGMHTIFIRDTDLIRDVCVKNADYFPDHRAFIDEKMDPIFGKNVFSLRGQRWKEVRNMLSPSFTASKMKFMFQLVSNCANQFVEYFAKHPEITECMDVKDSFTRYTNDVIATAAFGLSVNSLENRTNEFYVRGKEASSFGGLLRTIKFMLSFTFPRLMRLAGQGFLSRSTSRFFRTLVADTVKARDEQSIVRPDMIHLLMQARDNKDGAEITNDDIVAQAFIFFLAGFETSSNLMCFIAQELAVNPDIQEKLRQEVEENLTDSDDVPYETLAKLKYMDMVINETLRKYPPVAMTDRVCAKSFVIPASMPGYSDYRVQVGVNLTIPIYALHHDPKYFPNPDVFDPERFNDENKDKIDPYTYMPFGLGPRKCIANRFALMETKILFARILQNFVLKPTEKTIHPVVFSKSLVMLPEKGFWVKFEPRKKMN